MYGHTYVAEFLGQGHSRLNLGYLGSFCSLGLGGTGRVCTGVLVSGARRVSGSRLYGGAVGLRSPFAAFLVARMPSAPRPSPARALAAASVAARAGRCGASRWPLFAVAITIAICLLSGALLE